MFGKKRLCDQVEGLSGQAERLVCGTPSIDVVALERMTVYDDSMPGGRAHPVHSSCAEGVAFYLALC